VRQNLAAFADRRFSLLFAARTCSVLGSAFGPVALSFGVLALPGATAGTLSLVVAAESVSMVVFMLLGGVVADRLPRFRVMVAADLTAALAWGALAAMLISGWAPLGVLVVVSAVAGMATALFYPAFTGLVPEVIPPDRLQAANGILRLGMNAARIGGFAVAGAAVAGLGPGWAMCVNVGLLLASALLIAGLRLPVTSRSEGGNVLRDMREGWHEFRTRQWLWVVVLQYSFVVMALQAVWGVLGPVLANDRLGGARAWSYLLGAESVGMVLGVIFAIRARPRRPIRLVVMLTFPLASLPVALGLGAPFVVALGAAFLGGIALDILSVVWDTTMQREIPDAALSRVSSYDALGSLMFGPLGLLLAGPAVLAVGVGPALLISAGVIALASLAALCAPDVWRLSWIVEAAPGAQPGGSVGSDGVRVVGFGGQAGGPGQERDRIEQVAEPGGRQQQGGGEQAIPADAGGAGGASWRVANQQGADGRSGAEQQHRDHEPATRHQRREEMAGQG
jgi:MFS family permease